MPLSYLPSGAMLPSNLPLVSLLDHRKTRHTFDIISIVNLNERFKKDLANISKESRFHNLPTPFRLKESPNALYKFQLAAIPLPKRKRQSYLVKHITFPKQVKANIAKGLSYEECHDIL